MELKDIEMKNWNKFFALFITVALIGSIQNAYCQNKDLGVGPIKSQPLGELDKKMADDGKSLYNSKCMVCHDLDQNKVGPALRNVTKTRTPEFFMNLMLNTVQMQKENATIKELTKKYNNVPMPDPALKQNQARSILEYLRSVAK